MQSTLSPPHQHIHHLLALSPPFPHVVISSSSGHLNTTDGRSVSGLRIHIFESDKFITVSLR
ncbi:hypothetical protein EON65_03475 [archaeon]|nr:MAG: hypothetical protein EON65_03475 [archaeon]